MLKSANDFSSYRPVEENVVRCRQCSLIVLHQTEPLGVSIKAAGFEPQLRNQLYQWRTDVKHLEQQVIDCFSFGFIS
jgi:cyclic dehypoxanthinyl futalosine synthase